MFCFSTLHDFFFPVQSVASLSPLCFDDESPEVYVWLQLCSAWLRLPASASDAVFLPLSLPSARPTLAVQTRRNNIRKQNNTEKNFKKRIIIRYAEMAGVCVWAWKKRFRHSRTSLSELIHALLGNIIVFSVWVLSMKILHELPVTNK